MERQNIMMVPKLSVDEYSDIVTDHNRRARKGMLEPCPSHRWARLPQDTEADPHLICVYCLRAYRPSEPRIARPLNGADAMPLRGPRGPI